MVLRILRLNLNINPHKVRTESNPTHVKSNTPGMKKFEKGEFFKKTWFICSKEPSDLSISRNPPIQALIPRNKCKKYNRYRMILYSLILLISLVF